MNSHVAVTANDSWHDYISEVSSWISKIGFNFAWINATEL